MVGGWNKNEKILIRKFGNMLITKFSTAGWIFLCRTPIKMKDCFVIFHLTYIGCITFDEFIRSYVIFLISYIIMSHHSSLYKFIYQTQLQNKYLKLKHWNIFSIHNTVETPPSKIVYNTKYYIKWWTPKFASVKFGPDHVISGLNQIDKQFIWWFIAHMVGSDWS